MSPSSLVGLASALAFTLGVLALASWLARRFAPGAGLAKRPGRIEVVSRTNLAPRQGVATLRIEGRVMLVSFGEGGVRHLADVDPLEELAAEDDEAPAVVERRPVVEGRGAEGRAGRGRFRVLSALLLVALALVNPARPLAAQQGGGQQPATSAPSSGTPGTGTGTAPSAASALSAALSGQAGGGAPQVALQLGSQDDGLQVSGTVGTVLLIGFMTVIPTLLLLMTGFTRILIVLHLLKQALGTQTAPPAHLLTAMALLLTGFVMAPTFEQVHQRAIAPWMAGEIDEVAMLREASVPMRSFMLASTREQDLAAFLEMREGPRPETIDDVPMVVVTAAFVTSELTHAFQMGFALFLPFVVIDIVVASVLMSMGMFMLPPVMVSLPFKLLLFVLVDGWALVMSSLVQSF